MILGVTAFKTEDKTEKYIFFCQIKSTVCSFLTLCKCLVGFCFGREEQEFKLKCEIPFKTLSKLFY